MTPKDYLLQLELFDTKIKQKQEQRQMYLEMATSITASLNPVKVQRTPVTDRMGDAVVNAAHMEEKIEADINALFEKKNLVIHQIQQLHNVLYMQVLFKRYVQYKSLYQVSSEIDRGYSYTIELHKKALVEFGKVHSSMLKELDSNCVKEGSDKKV